MRVLYLLKPYLFFIALTIAIHHKPNKTYWSWVIFCCILVGSDLKSKLLEFLEIRTYLLVCIKLSGKLMMKWECSICLKPYLFFIALTIAIHHKSNKTYWSWVIFCCILVGSDLKSKLLEFLEIHTYLIVCIKLSGKLMMKWEW